MAATSIAFRLSATMAAVVPPGSETTLTLGFRFTNAATNGLRYTWMVDEPAMSNVSLGGGSRRQATSETRRAAARAAKVRIARLDRHVSSRDDDLLALGRRLEVLDHLVSERRRWCPLVERHHAHDRV